MCVCSSQDRNDMDIVREHHRFVWREEDETVAQTWEKDLAKKYYDKLFKEYGVCDLSRYKENKVCAVLCYILSTFTEM